GVASKGVAESIRKHTSKPVHEFSIQGVGGTPASIEKGIKIAEKLVAKSKNVEPEDVLFSDVSIGFISNRNEPYVNDSATLINQRSAEFLIQQNSTVVYGDSNELYLSNLMERCNCEQIRKRISSIRDNVSENFNIGKKYNTIISNIGGCKEIVKYAERFKKTPGIIFMEGSQHETEQIT